MPQQKSERESGRGGGGGGGGLRSSRQNGNRYVLVHPSNALAASLPFTLRNTDLFFSILADTGTQPSQQDMRLPSFHVWLQPSGPVHRQGQMPSMRSTRLALTCGSIPPLPQSHQTRSTGSRPGAALAALCSPADQLSYCETSDPRGRPGCEHNPRHMLTQWCAGHVVYAALFSRLEQLGK